MVGETLHNDLFVVSWETHHQEWVKSAPSEFILYVLSLSFVLLCPFNPCQHPRLLHPIQCLLSSPFEFISLYVSDLSSISTVLEICDVFPAVPRPLYFPPSLPSPNGMAVTHYHYYLVCFFLFGYFVFCSAS